MTEDQLRSCVATALAVGGVAENITYSNACRALEAAIDYAILNGYVPKPVSKIRQE